VTPSKMAKFLL